MGWRTNGERVLVRPADTTKETTTPGGLVVVENQKEKPNIGVIVEGNSSMPAGWTVMYARYGGQDITIDEVPHVVLDSNDILLIHTDDD